MAYEGNGAVIQAEGDRLDYVQLAVDFYLYQDLEKIPEIRLKWGRDFYRYCNVKAENEEEKENG